MSLLRTRPPLFQRCPTPHSRSGGRRERETKRDERMGDRETEGERETVRLLVGRGETPAEEGGHGLPGATYTPRPFTSPRGCACVNVCCFYVPTCVRVHVRLWLLTFRVAAVLLLGVLVLVERELAWKDEVLSTFFTEWLCGERAWCKQGALNAVTNMLTKTTQRPEPDVRDSSRETTKYQIVSFCFHGQDRSSNQMSNSHILNRFLFQPR